MLSFQHPPAALQCSRRLTIPLGFRAVLLLLFLLACLIWPVYGPERPVTPGDYLSALSLGPLEPRPVSAATIISLVVSPPVELVGIAPTTKAAQAVSGAEFAKTHATELRKRPYLLPGNLRFAVATTQKHCSLVLELESGQRSNPVDCAGVSPNGVAEFAFSPPVLPGQHTLRFVTPPSDLSVVLAPSTADSNLWAIPNTRARSFAAQALFTWFMQSPLLALAYLGFSMAGAAAFFFLLHRKPHIVPLALLLSLSVCNALITKPFSGHDETAHIQMFHETAVLSGIPADDVASKRLAFFAEARQQMLDGDFFRLHGVLPQAADQCPHMIIGSCGESERPARLYRFYASLLRPFGLLPQTPLGIGIFGRIISFVLLGIFLSLSFVTFYRPVFWAASLLLLFVGGWHAQAPSLSNDLPMFLWGFFLAGTLVSVVLGPFSRLGVLWRATLPLLLLVPLSFIERSWLAGVPSLLALVLVSITALVPPIRKQNTPRWIPALTILVGLTAVLAFAVRWVLPYLLAHYAAPFSRLSELNPDIAFLANIGKINLHEFYLFSLWHLKSWAGTFVWGHTELPWLVRTSWIVVWSSLCALGVLTLFREFRSATTRTLPILILLTLAAPLLISHFLVVEASGSYMFHQDLGIAQSFAKARLTAPGGAALSLLPLCALSAFLKRPPLRLQTCSYAALAAFSWALAYWLPSTYLIAVL